MRWEAAEIAAAALLAVAVPAKAMQFHPVPLTGSQDSVVIEATGPIIQGDFNRLITLIRGLPATDRIMGFALDSPGGNLVEAEKLARFIRAVSATVGVLQGDKCASACFLVFAAGVKKFVAADALIGVHSASNGGQETPESMAITTAMARDAGELGVPLAIVGKIIETQPERMEWLTPSDLRSMGVYILQPQPAAPVSAEPRSPAGPDQGNTGATAVAPGAPQASAASQQGLADRRSWEQWFAALTGDYRDGAEFWASRRSDPNPGSCYGAQGQPLGDWTAGCLAAQQRLAQSDVRRKTEVDYYRGWNSY